METFVKARVLLLRGAVERDKIQKQNTTPTFELLCS